MLESLSNALEKKETSPEEILSQYLKKIEAKDADIKAFLEVETEEAMQAAKASSERWAKNEPLSAWDGIPIGIKDNIVTKGRKTTCASKILEGFVSPYSAHVIEKLHQAGMVTIGRLNMDEFAMGSSTENSGFHTTRNPHDLERAPGGSSGGSAAAVAAGFVPAALGSDTGGSIRQPASFCGTVGLKPTYGTVSRYGLVAFASSLDQIGPLTMNVQDAEIIYNIIAGRDDRDSTTVDISPADYFKNKSLNRLIIGVVPELTALCDSDTRKAFTKSLEILCEKIPYAMIIEASLPNLKYGIPVYYLTATSEASTNLSRFDGVRYGFRDPKAESLEQLYEFSRTHGFGSEVKRRILLGTYALSSGYYDAFYGKAQKVRSSIRNDYLMAFEKVDTIAIPSSPSAAFKIGEKVNDPVQMYLSDVLTVGASLAGIPALSVPMPSEKLPLGLQLQGPYFSEPMLFSLGKVLESGVRRSI